MVGGSDIAKHKGSTSRYFLSKNSYFREKDPQIRSLVLVLLFSSDEASEGIEISGYFVREKNLPSSKRFIFRIPMTFGSVNYFFLIKRFEKYSLINNY